ncbi:hypothetical protein KAR91_70710 [Candidatus Pacearchaeota archaeon]|nr:hypothetical protein [Candidatus Pacearchaeota archaeon]
MKYYYLFILIGIIAGSIFAISLLGKSELNSDQEKQIENSITRSQDEEKAVTNKADGLMANTPYYLGKLHDKVMPMAADNQFVMPVLKYGIPGKEPEYDYHSESLRLESITFVGSVNQKAVILNRSKKIGNRLGEKKKSNERKASVTQGLFYASSQT